MLGAKACHFTPLPSLTLDELVLANHVYHHLDRVPRLSARGAQIGLSRCFETRQSGPL